MSIPVGVVVNEGQDVLLVPEVRQEDDYTCGVACALAVLRYWRKDAEGTERDLRGALEPDPETGTDARKMVALFQARGLQTRHDTGLTLDDLANLLRDGWTPIVLMQAWTDGPVDARNVEFGHYVVVLGMRPRGDVLMMDPGFDDDRGQYGRVPVEEFEKAWIGADGRVRRGDVVAVRGEGGARGPLPGEARRVRTGRESKGDLTEARGEVPAWIRAMGKNSDRVFTGPNGNEALGYEWKWKWGLKPDKEGGLVDARVSDWDEAQECSTCSRPIVHVYWIRDKVTGAVEPYGVEHLHVALGYSHTVTKKEQETILKSIDARGLADRRVAGRMDRLVAKLSKERRELEAARTTLSAWEQAKAVASKKPEPPIEKYTSDVGHRKARMGSATVWLELNNGVLDKRLEDQLRRSWLEAEATAVFVKETGQHRAPYEPTLRQDIERLEGSIEKAQKELHALMPGKVTKDVVSESLTEGTRVLYHGATQSFTKFDVGRAGRRDSGNMGRGIYLSTTPRMAMDYAEDNVKRFGGTPTVLKIEARLGRVADLAAVRDRLEREAGVSFPPEAQDKERSERMREWFLANSYDAVASGDEVAVFDASKLRVLGKVDVPTDAERGKLVHAALQAKDAARARRLVTWGMDEARSDLPPVKPGHVRLYRGTSTKHKIQSLSKADPGALFGPGIYLTSSRRIAGDYTTKGAGEEVIFRYGGSSGRTSKQAVIDTFIRQTARYMDDQGRPGWEQPGIPREYERFHLEDDPGRRERIKKATAIWKKMEKDHEVRVGADGEAVIRKKVGQFDLGVYDVPQEWVTHTIDAEAPIDEKVALCIYDVLRKVVDPMRAGRAYDWMTDDEDGEPRTFREVYREFSDVLGDHHAEFRRALKERGVKVKGVRYAGGVTIGGAGHHDAFAFWDEQGLAKLRVNERAETPPVGVLVEAAQDSEARPLVEFKTMTSLEKMRTDLAHPVKKDGTPEQAATLVLDPRNGTLFTTSGHDYAVVEELALTLDHKKKIVAPSFRRGVGASRRFTLWHPLIRAMLTWLVKLDSRYADYDLADNYDAMNRGDRVMKLGRFLTSYAKAGTQVPPALYHGTSMLYFDDIMRHGLRPREDTGTRPGWGGFDTPSIADRVYLTAKADTAKNAVSGVRFDLNRDFMLGAVGDGRAYLGVVFKVKVPDPSLLLPDEDCDCQTWEDSLKTIGSVAYHGRIPASHLKPILLVTGNFNFPTVLPWGSDKATKELARVSRPDKATAAPKRLAAMGVTGESAATPTGVLVETAQVVFDEETIKKLRADYLLLMRNVDRVHTEADLDEFSDGVKKFHAYLSAIFLRADSGGESSPFLDAVRRLNLSGGYAEAWDKALREKAWTFAIGMEPPGAHKSRDPDDNRYRLSRWMDGKKKWKGRVDRAAREFWKELDYVFKAVKGWNRGQPISVSAPTEPDIVTLEGVKVIVKTNDGTLPNPEKWKAAFRLVHQRTAQVFPWMWQHRVPVSVMDLGLDRGGQYLGGRIDMDSTPTGGPEQIAGTYIHEMGHHIWRVILSNQDQRYWRAAYDSKRMHRNLRDLLAKWPADEITTYGWAEKVQDSDPVLALHLHMLASAYGNRGRMGDIPGLWTREDAEKMLADGKTSIDFPAHPITAYAAKNEEEAFCEALKLTVAYGPRTLDPLIAQLLKDILGQRIRIGESLTENVDPLAEPERIWSMFGYMMKRNPWGAVLKALDPLYSLQATAMSHYPSKPDKPLTPAQMRAGAESYRDNLTRFFDAWSKMVNETKTDIPYAGLHDKLMRIVTDATEGLGIDEAWIEDDAGEMHLKPGVTNRAMADRIQAALEKAWKGASAALAEAFPEKIEATDGIVIYNCGFWPEKHFVNAHHLVMEARRLLQAAGVGRLLRGRRFFVGKERSPFEEQLIAPGERTAGAYLQPGFGKGVIFPARPDLKSVHLAEGDVGFALVREDAFSAIKTIIHELGHAFWFEEMREAERQEFGRTMEMSTGRVTAYSDKNVSENFAETFTLFVTKKNAGEWGFKNDPESIERFRALLRTGRMGGMHEGLVDFSKIDLKAKYAEFNKKYFDGALPHGLPVTWGNVKGASGVTDVGLIVRRGSLSILRAKNRFEPITMEDAEVRVKSIKLSTTHRYDEAEFDGVLLHEMLHAWLALTGWPFEQHGHRFQEEAARLSHRAGIVVPLTHELKDVEVAAPEKEVGVLIAEPREEGGPPSFMLFAPKAVREFEAEAASLAPRIGRTTKVYLVRTRAYTLTTVKQKPGRGITMYKLAGEMAKHLDLTHAKLVASFEARRLRIGEGLKGKKLSDIRGSHEERIEAVMGAVDPKRGLRLEAGGREWMLTRSNEGHGKWRISYFKNGTPTGHRTEADLGDAVAELLDSPHAGEMVVVEESKHAQVPVGVLLSEVFDHPFPWKNDDSPRVGGATHTATFVSTVREYVVSVNQVIVPAGKVPRIAARPFAGDKPAPTQESHIVALETHFLSRPKGSKSFEDFVSIRSNDNIEPDVLRVFATCAAIMSYWHKKYVRDDYEPSQWRVWSVADDQQRLRLYGKMATKLAHDLGGWKVSGPHSDEGLRGWFVTAPHQVRYVGGMFKAIRVPGTLATVESALPVGVPLTEAGEYGTCCECGQDVSAAAWHHGANESVVCRSCYNAPGVVHKCEGCDGSAGYERAQRLAKLRERADADGWVDMLSEDKLPGGRADKKKPSDFDAKELALGTEHETEHTNDRALAREIAMDHLSEDPRYYSKLKAGIVPKEEAKGGIPQAATFDQAKALAKGGPFKSPHYTASTRAVIEELKMARGGVLYLRDLPDFSKLTIETVVHALKSEPTVTLVIDPRPEKDPFGQRRWDEHVKLLHKVLGENLSWSNREDSLPNESPYPVTRPWYLVTPKKLAGVHGLVWLVPERVEGWEPDDFVYLVNVDKRAVWGDIDKSGAWQNGKLMPSAHNVPLEYLPQRHDVLDSMKKAGFDVVWDEPDYRGGGRGRGNKRVLVLNPAMIHLKELVHAPVEFAMRESVERGTVYRTGGMKRALRFGKGTTTGNTRLGEFTISGIEKYVDTFSRSVVRVGTATIKGQTVRVTRGEAPFWSVTDDATWESLKGSLRKLDEAGPKETPAAKRAKKLVAITQRGQERQGAEDQRHRDNVAKIRQRTDDQKLKAMTHEAVLAESAKGIADLPPGVGVRIRKMNPGSIQVMYWSTATGHRPGKGAPADGVLMLARDPKFMGPCDKAWMIEWAEATQGWGPLLYDVAVEVSTKLGGGLMADRKSVSADAHRVWMFYMQKRSDVTVHQLDTLDIPHLTGRPDDDCQQGSAKEWAMRDHLGGWTNAPESKRITKDDHTTLKALKAAGLLVTDGVPASKLGV